MLLGGPFGNKDFTEKKTKGAQSFLRVPKKGTFSFLLHFFPFGMFIVLGSRPVDPLQAALCNAPRR